MSSPIKRYRFSLLFLLGFMILPACWDEEGSDIRTPTYDITAVAIDPVNPDVVYLGTGSLASSDVAAGGDGVYKSIDGGGTWRRIEAGLLDRRIGALAVDLFDLNTVYAGTEGGIYEGIDTDLNEPGVESWHRLVGSGTGITAIVIDRNTCNNIGQPCRTVYAASESVGVFLSNDGGSNWEPLPGISEQAVKSLAIHPPLYLPGQCDDVQDQEDCPPLFGTTTLYAGTEGGHVFRFDRLTKEWVEDKPTLSDDTTQEVLSLAVDPITPSILYAGLRIESGGIDNLYISVGGIWSNIVVPSALRDSVHVVDLAIAPDEKNVNVLTTYVGISGLSKSTDGVKWDPINNGLDKTVLSLAIDPLTPATMYAGSFNSRLFKTVDGGQKWLRIDISF